MSNKCVTLKDCKGNEFIVDAEDCEAIKKYKWYTLPNGYLAASGQVKIVYLHRLVMNAPQGSEVDHINHCKNDCRKSNLRVCNRYENARNRPAQANNLSGYKGVGYHKHKKLWRARIKIHHKTTELGYFKTPEEAHEAYKEAAKRYHGEYACT